ncbi:MAG: citrate lyase holo-[acyl-carrier protein] synthase, partial [Asgard group archaeon]|nr:citrate lyase holo-[acyl-carrier protein] synthase [Asgard group archaeon]
NILTDIREYFAKNDLLVQKELINTSNLGPEALFFINFKPEKLKQKMIELEENHIIGRILDIDVIDKTGKPIERNRKRKCLLCDKLAIICMRESNHSPIELREVIDKELEKYLILHEKEK